MNSDIYLKYGGDYQVSQSGDLMMVSGAELTKQRIIRRMLTVPGAYIWHANYGAGLSRFIGQPLSRALYNEITALVISQIYLEETVAKSPPPEIQFQPVEDGLFCQINYFDADQNQPQALAFTVTK
jgi:hypothetical protein